MSELSVHPVGRFFVKRDGSLGPASWSGLALVVLLAFTVGYLLRGGPAAAHQARLAPAGAHGAAAAPGRRPTLTPTAAVPALRLPVRHHHHRHHRAAATDKTAVAPVATAKPDATATPQPTAAAPVAAPAPVTAPRPVATRAPAVLVPIHTPAPTPAPQGPTFDSSG